MSAKCSSCGAEIIWAETVKGKAIPIDPAPEKRIVLSERHKPMPPFAEVGGNTGQAGWYPRPHEGSRRQTSAEVITMTEGQELMSPLRMMFDALADAAFAHLTEREKKVDKALESFQVVRRLFRQIDFPLGGDRSIRIELRGPEPTKDTFEQIVALVKAMAMGAPDDESELKKMRYENSELECELAQVKAERDRLAAVEGQPAQR